MASESSADIDHGDVGETSRQMQTLTPITVENENLSPSNKISRESTKIFKKSLHDEGSTWGLVPSEKKLECFEELRKLFSWDPALDSVVRDLWMKKAGPIYNHMLYNVRKAGRRPPYMSEDIWAAWSAKWTAEDYSQKSIVARRNRMTEPSGPGTGIAIHRGGTRSAYEHGLQLLKEGTPKNKLHFAIYNKLHKKGEVYDTLKSAHYAEEIEREIAELSQPPPGSTEPIDVDENAVVIDKLGRVISKGHMYGIGSQGRMYIAARGSSSQARVDRVDLENASLKRKITELEESMKTQAEEMQARVSAEVDAQLQVRLEDQMKMLCEKFIPGWKPPGSS